MSSLSKEFLIQEYINKKRSFSSIAKQLGTYPNKVRRAAIEMGIAPRSKSSAQKYALKSGRHAHPTKGRGHSTRTKEKISDTTYKYWEEMDDEEKNKRSEIGKKHWDSLTEEQKKNIHQLSGEAIRKASKEGSKLEKYLFESLTKHGFRVDFHREHMLLNERLHIDLFLPDISTAIEVDGPSHFEPVWGDEALSRTQRSDQQKTGLLLSSGFVLIRVKQTKGLSEKYKRETLSKILSELKQIKKKYPSRENRYIEIGD